ncbi:hypothetical protein DSC91_006484 [Paraburkholderia caffeinilytica]|uniref:Uncharacterized protein n=1 Tax=Paraburkholderia caffeinilytica TaxID=1761016 RepID=A0ABQ1M0P1_9BURK|nr:hypothetical protein [Paraburkholderia caffeinilytica]AXL53179.1 hypothetical protein DSC91_006484 [Paraburkholderia caffeinilytica]GGC32312.1 hypothetical protein GCM10011400_18710 [Paraburkholderia caffeinilytica]CAB3796561.1 hypothetical protein LMG28690_04360 [Paraburkholderia caffeinilytica]
MTNAINNIGNGTPFDMGDVTPPVQDDMQSNTNSTTVRMFSTEHTNDVGGDMQPGFAGAARHAGNANGLDGDMAAQQADAAAQPGGADPTKGMESIMDIIKGVISAIAQLVPPLAGMMASVAGGAGAAGGGAA